MPETYFQKQVFMFLSRVLTLFVDVYKCCRHQVATFVCDGALRESEKFLTSGLTFVTAGAALIINLELTPWWDDFLLRL